MHSNNYTLAFVFIITVLLGTILSFTKENLRELQEYNLRADMKKNILRSLDFEESENEPWSNEVVEKIVQEKTKKLLQEKQLKAYRQPKVEIKKYIKNEPVELGIKIDLQPEINIFPFNKISLIKYNAFYTSFYKSCHCFFRCYSNTMVQHCLCFRFSSRNLFNKTN